MKILHEFFNQTGTTIGGKKFEYGKVYSNPYARAFAPQMNEGEGEDHEVSMANNQLDSIIKNATELKSKIGENEKDIPAWIQDHITNSENYISQAASNYHEYGNSNEGINEGVRISLFDPNKNKILKTLSVDRNYREAEKEVETLNKRLSTSEKNKGYYWKVTTIGESINESSPCWKGYKQVGMKDKNGKEVPNCVPINEGLLKEVRSVKVVQKEIDKILSAIQTALSQYKAHKGTANEKKHVDNLKKLTKLRKDLEDEMELSVSQLYKDAEFDV